ncbi:hypothetical protein ACQ4XT_18670 [Halobacillus faecis]
MWAFLGLIGLLVVPLLYGFLRDAFGWNRNKFYGDEMNKQKRNSVEKRYDKAETRTEEVRQHSRNHGNHGGFGGFH